MPDQQEHKTITFSFDGTGNEPGDAGRFTEDESVSNVLKLHVLMGGGFEADRTDTKTDGGEDQVTFYYNGIGTREEGRSIPLLGRLRDALNMAMALCWGDATRILQEARRDFESACYEEGGIIRRKIRQVPSAPAKSRSMASPLVDSTTEMSCCACRFIQNAAPVPRKRPRRTAVSAVTARSPRRIAVIRLAGTRSASASLLALIPRAASSALKTRPGCVLSLAIRASPFSLCGSPRS